MKKIKFIISIIIFILVTGIFSSIYADDEATTTTTFTDFSNAKVIVTEKDDGNGYWSYYNISVSGIKSNEESSYMIYFTNDDNLPTKPSTEEEFEKMSENYLLGGETEKELKNFYTYVEKKGDIYGWILECTKDGKIGDFYKVKLGRPEQHKTGNRIKGYFFKDSSSIFLYEATADKTKRNVKVKIGTITDTGILNSIKNGESNCLDKLLAYSKTASSIYTGTLPLGDSAEIVSKMKLNAYSYYYVYFELDDENGKYYPVEDTSLYMAYPDGNGNTYLVDYLDSNFKWNIENNANPTTTNNNNNNNAKDTTTATRSILKAGVKNVVLISALLAIVCGIIFAIKNVKYRDIK